MEYTIEQLEQLMLTSNNALNWKNHLENYKDSIGISKYEVEKNVVTSEELLSVIISEILEAQDA